MAGSTCGQVVVEQLPAETLVATGAVGDNLICQAIINSGIGLETETTMPAETTTTMAAEVVEEMGQDEVEEEEVEEEEHQQSPETIEKVLFEDPDSEQIHVTEECVEMEMELEMEEEVEVSAFVCVCLLLLVILVIVYKWYYGWIRNMQV